MDLSPFPQPSGKTLVTVATYNEMENLPRLVEEIFRFAPQVDILVIDDNSPDGTGQWCDRQQAQNPRIFCLHRPGKLGLGTAIVAGMKYAIQHGYSVRAQHGRRLQPPAEIPAAVAGRHGPAGPTAGRRDDRLALHSGRRRGGLAAGNAG